MAELTPDQSPAPWVPETDAIRLKVLGKLAEELAEGGAATARCIIQGIDEVEPVSGKTNRLWLHEEIADIEANIELAKVHLGLNRHFIDSRRVRKLGFLTAWLEMLPSSARREPPTAEQVEADWGKYTRDLQRERELWRSFGLGVASIPRSRREWLRTALLLLGGMLAASSAWILWAAHYGLFR